MVENISLSFQGILSHKLRSLLTMLGIIIGIASIITIVSTIKGTNEQIKANLIGAGNNVVDVKLKQGGNDLEFQWTEVPSGVRVITEKTRKAVEQLEGVEAASLYRKREYADGVYYKNTAYNGSIYGIDSHYFTVNGYRVTLGRGFSAYDAEHYRRIAVIDSDTASSLFPGINPIGQTLEISQVPFTIIGIAKKSAAQEPKIENINDYQMYMSEGGGTIFIPIESWPIPYRYDEPQNVAVKAASTDDMKVAGSGAAKLLTATQITDTSSEDDGNRLAYEADQLSEQVARMQSLSNSTNRQLIWIAGISLLVGGIGVMNIMLVSVTERTKEIGLKKAIGAKRRTIAAQFLTEAAVLTSLGGLIGVGSGIGLSKALARIMGTPSAISIAACIIAVAFSMVIGVVFGLLPAMKASKLNPIDALRYE